MIDMKTIYPIDDLELLISLGVRLKKDYHYGVRINNLRVQINYEFDGNKAVCKPSYIIDFVYRYLHLDKYEYVGEGHKVVSKEVYKEVLSKYEESK